MLHKATLPIDAHLSKIAGALQENPSLILSASPGSGKTTRVAPFLLDALYGDSKQEVWVLEPRRLAARMAAERVAKERGQSIAEEVGYQFRWENKTGPKTRIRFLTEGTLVKILQKNPMLPSVGTIILDEFHERHISTDIALALLLELQKKRPELKLVITSATLQSEALSSKLKIPTYTVEAQLYPVQFEYVGNVDPREVPETIARIIRQSFRSNSNMGDTLVFLPGMSEIRRTEQALLPFARQHGLLCCTLHGELTADEQRQAVEPSTQKKIILSTNIAESSVTIEGIKTVVDSGLHRLLCEDPATGIPVLRTQKTSKSSCIQRAHRAGRLGPGHCIRLFTESDFKGRPEADLPEILRTDLSGPLLEIRDLGFHEETLFWCTDIPRESWKRAEELLSNLGALKEKALTQIGHRMAELPLPCRLSRFLLEAEKENVLNAAVDIAAVLSEGDYDAVDLMEAASRKASDRRSDPRWRKRIASCFPSSQDTHQGVEDLLHKALLVAFADRVAQRRKPFGKKIESFTLSDGGSASMPLHAVLGDHSHFVVPVLQKSSSQTAKTSDATIRSIVPIEELWLLDMPQIAEKKEYIWTGEKLQLSEQTCYGALVLESRSKPIENTKEAARVFVAKALGVSEKDFETASLNLWLDKLRKMGDTSEIEQACYRLLFWAKHRSRTLASWSDLFLQALEGVYSSEQLKNHPWTESLFPQENRVEIQRFAPSYLQLNPKRKAPITYAVDRPPAVESRLQDFMGLKTNPTIADGKVPLTLHLLAPNGRAVQVTQDLASFWKNTYPELKKQLQRRYPKHAWPDI